MTTKSSLRFLEDRWDESVAAKLDAPELLRYRSNLLGSDLRITNFGGGNTSSKLEEVDPLDGFDEPPRYAIRRRMVRTMIDVASANHASWFILAHSMGSVIAFNGLMEPEETLPNYLDETRWKTASARFAQTPGPVVPDPLPHLPSWIPPGSRLASLRRPRFSANQALSFRASRSNMMAMVSPSRAACR